MTVYANGRKALGICDICGLSYKLVELKQVIRNRVPTNLKACPQCWDPHHEQDDLGKYNIQDPQALRDPRPDHSEFPTMREIIIEVPNATAAAYLAGITAEVG